MLHRDQRMFLLPRTTGFVSILELIFLYVAAVVLLQMSFFHSPSWFGGFNPTISARNVAGAIISPLVQPMMGALVADGNG